MKGAPMLAQRINKKRLIDTFIKLIKINSPSFGERELGDMLAVMLKKAGCTVELQEYGRSFNLIARKKGNSSGIPPLLLSAHMDTIEPTTGLEFTIDDDSIRTTGPTILGADDKSALAQIIEATTVLGESDIPHGDIEIIFTSVEEKGLLGARHLDFTTIRSRHALVLDSSGGVGNLVIAAPTHITYEMHITGKSAHAGIEPEKGISAIRVAAQIISEIPDGRIDAETTANVGTITGGTATNVVPKEVVIHGELRGHSPAVIEATKGAIYAAAHRITARNKALIHITEQEEYKAFRIESDDPFLCFLDGVYTTCGITPAHVTTGGGSDANVFNHRGIKAINLSNGMQKVHSTEEFIHISDLYNGCLIVVNALAQFRKISAYEAAGR